MTRRLGRLHRHPERAGTEPDSSEPDPPGADEDAHKNDFVTPEVEATLKRCRDRPGLYLMKDARGAVVNASKAQSLRNRVRRYWQKQSAGRESHRTPELSANVAPSGQSNRSPRSERARTRIVEAQLTVTSGDARAGAAADYVRAARAQVDAAYRLAGYLLGNPAEAEDAVQDALVKAWRSWPTLRDPQSFGPWFDRIVVNVCRDRMRRHRTLRMVELDAASEVESSDVFGSMLAGDEVVAAVARLSPDHQVVIALRYWRDLSLEQLADTLGLPLGTVKSRLHYALRALRAELEGKER
jgi:RNA polymerase sigma-70 factor (ECF subfamily)